MTPPRESRRVAGWTWAALLAVCALAFGLRFGALSRLLPVRPEPDQYTVVAYAILSGQQLEHPEYYYGTYPILWPYVLAATTGSSWTDHPAPAAPLAEHLDAAARPYVVVRVLMAALSSLVVPLSFLVVRRWVGDGWALLVAAFMATALMHVAHSSVCKGHAAAATLMWLTLWLAMRQLEAPSVPRIVATSCAGILAIGTFHTGLFMALPMAAAALLARRTSRTNVVCAWLAVPVTVLAGLAFTPGETGFTSDVDLGAMHSAGFKLGATGHAIVLDNLDGSGLLLWPRFLWEHDAVLAVLAGIGLLIALRAAPRAWREPRLRDDVLVVLAFAVPYTALISLDSFVQERYLLPLYPLLALLAALCARATLGRLPGTRVRVLACTVLLLPAAFLSCRYTLLGRSPSTFDRLGEWIERQPGATGERFLIAPGVTPPLLPTQAALQSQLACATGKSSPWFAYLGELERLPTSAPAYDLRPLAPELFLRGAALTQEELAQEFERVPAEWVVLNVSRRIMREPATKVVYAYVREHGRLVTTISGEDERFADATPLEYQGVRDLGARLLHAQAFGPRLEVYRLEKR